VGCDLNMSLFCCAGDLTFGVREVPKGSEVLGQRHILRKPVNNTLYRFLSNINIVLPFIYTTHCASQLQDFVP